ncbi:hypothetical protein U3516DRAFT_640185 [Neocallimastix sp. 'constans']|jgi:hypothetical protein
MRLLSKNIISVAILLASSLKTLARPVTSKHPIELKGVGSLISANQERVNHHVREEEIDEKQETNLNIDIEPFGPIFDLVCQSDISDWCSLNLEQCSFVKTLCVKNNEGNYCAFDIYKQYLEVTDNNTKPLASYTDLCNDCLINMSNEFQRVSKDLDSISKIDSITEMCKIKKLMRIFVFDKSRSSSNQNGNIISTLASLAPSNNSKLEKRNYGKIHSFKNPEVNGFVKSSGKVKFGEVGVNEKVNSSIHLKNLKKRFIKEKSKRQEEVTDEEMMMMDIKDKIALAIENIKELALQKVNSVLSNLEINVNVMLEDDLFIADPENTREKNVITNEILGNIKNILNDIDDGEEGDDEDDEVVEEDKTDLAEEITENASDIFESESQENISMNKKSEAILDENGIFKVNENDPIYDVFIAEVPTATNTLIEPTDIITEESIIPTQAVPDESEEGSGEEGSSEEGSSEEDDDDKSPIFKPGKPSWPFKLEHSKKPGHSKKPSKFGWPHKQHVHTGRSNDILHSINRIFEEKNERKESQKVNQHEHVSSKKHSWAAKKSEIFGNEIHRANEESTENKEVKLNRNNNHRDTNEEVYEVGSKKVNWINNVHLTKPSLNFRDDKK